MLNRWAVGQDGCAVCDSAMRRFRHEWLRKCSSCGVLSAAFDIAIPDKPGDAVLDEAQREDGLAAVRERNNARLLRHLVTLSAPPGRLLDVGCGPGFLLSAARRQGYRPEGVEPDANVIRQAGYTELVRHGYFPDALPDTARFNVLVFNDVLEHIPDLRRSLAAAAHHLEPGGVLALNCPDRRGLFFRVAALADRLGMSAAYDRLWQRGLPSPHVWYFTPGNLAHAARRAGFSTVGTMRLDTITLKGLWSRIRCVKGQSLAVSLAAYTFALVTLPLSKLAPADAVVCFFRKD